MSLPEPILDDLSDAVILVTQGGDVVRYWNRAAESLYGWTAAEALGRTAGSWRLVYEDDLPAFERMIPVSYTHLTLPTN